MNELASSNQSNHDELNLSNYARSQFDRTFADKYESVLGHLVFERGYSIKRALESYAPIVKATHRETVSAKDWCQKIGFGSLGIGVLVGAGMGIGFAILPVLAGSLSLKLWSDSRSELPRREAEYHLLRTVPNLPQLLYSLALRGCDVVRLIGAYDALITAIEPRIERGDDFTESEVGEFLQTKITSFTGLEGETYTHQGIQPIGDAQNNAESPRAKDETLGISGVQSIAVAPSVQHITSPVWNPAQDLGENPQSALIVGTPGSGKGMTVSNAVRVLKSKNPTLTVMMIDPKGDPNERGYWEPVTDIFESFALMDCLDPDEGAAWLLSCMSKFQKLPAPKLLIFDELLAASIELEMADKSMKALPKLKKFMAGIVAQGDSKGVWVWAMSQSPQCSDLGLNGGVRGNLRIIAIVSPKNKTAIQVITSTKLVPMVEGGMDELRAIMAASPVGRAVFDGKLARWLPMPKLENYSGFDRDNRSISATPSPIASPAPSSEPSPSDITGTWREDFAKNLPPGLSESEFKARYDLEKSLREPWESSEPIEVAPVESTKSHPLKEKFDRLESLLESEGTISVKELQTKLKISTSKEAQQLAQMFCLSQKSRYKFASKSNPNGTTSYLIQAIT